MKFKAQKQKRHSIQKPMDVAYKVLRNTRVNDNLKKAAKMIKNNQPYQIITNQKSALYALDIVKGGFIVAGQKVTKDKKIVLAMVPNEDLGKLETGIDIAKAEKDQPKEEGSEELDSTGTGIPSPEELLAALPTGTDVLSKAINVAWEIEDNVLARTKYLSENSSADEMPRYIRLKKDIIGEYQNAALSAITRAVKEAKEKEKESILPQVLEAVKEEFIQSHALVAQKQISKPTQQIQSDSMKTLKDILLHISLKKVVEDLVTENKRRKGLDAFDRKYIFREKDLDSGVAALHDMSQARILQKDILRKVSRFLNHPPKNDVLKKMEAKNRARALTNQKKLHELTTRAKNQIGSLTKELKETIDKEIGESVTGLITQETLAISKEALVGIEKNADLIAGIIQQMRALLEEREKTIIEVAQEPEEMEQISEEEFEKKRSAEHLIALLKKDDQLPKEVRDIMLKALEKGFPEKYKALLSAYYASILQKKGNKP